MTITHTGGDVPWLLLIFSLPSSRSSERVGIWRKLQRYGAFSLRNSGYVLPNTPTTRERFEWLAASIRGFKGEASVLLVQAFDDLPDDVLRERFREERKPDYAAWIKELRALKPADPGFRTQLLRMKRRLEEIVEVDFFESALRVKAQDALHRAQQPAKPVAGAGSAKVRKEDFQKRVWITRPRPGIDRVSSAWLIRKFIDPKAVFIFDMDADLRPDAVPFDMYQPAGFGHQGDNCTFETLCHRFGLRDKKVALVAKAIHDADIEDDKFGRNEGIVLNQVLRGWAELGISDDELMTRGMDLIAGLYQAIQ